MIDLGWERRWERSRNRGRLGRPREIERIKEQTEKETQIHLLKILFAVVYVIQ